MQQYQPSPPIRPNNISQISFSSRNETFADLLPSFITDIKLLISIKSAGRIS